MPPRPADPLPDDHAHGGYVTQRDGLFGLWHEQPPVWLDEAFAGTIIPDTRPAPPGRVRTNGYNVEREAHAARRRDERERAQTPEAQEAKWKVARQQARAEMRRERQSERIAAGIVEAPVRAGEMTVSITVDPEVIAPANDLCGLMAAHISAAILPALKQAVKQAAEQVAAFSQATADLHQSMLQPWARTDPAVTERTIREIVNDIAALTKPVPKPPPTRERYLPGTRHARRGRKW